MQAEIITIGDEILIGQVVDTNSAFLASELHKIGIRVERITSVKDRRDSIITALDEASRRSRLIIMTGGLGPTLDDITKQSLAEYFQTKLTLNEQVLQHIKYLLYARGTELNERNIRQAEIPEGCKILHNTSGTAQGMWFEKNDTVYISLPGVPFEMESIMKDYGLPLIEKTFQLPPLRHITILTHGLAESAMAVKIEPWEKALPASLNLAYLPSPGILKLRLSCFDSETSNDSDLLREETAKLQSIIGNYIFGYDNDTIEEVTGQLLREKKRTLAVAESCTGGKIASLITSVPGCSDYFLGSVTAYSNAVKCHILGVQSASIQSHGAVSREVAEEMARGVRDRFHSDISIATTGIAGPSGGSIEKPVGTIWIALVTEKAVRCEKFNMGEHRGRNIQKAAIAALFMLRRELMQIP
jgi:nicotinamide-nucleotide amidase